MRAKKGSFANYTFETWLEASQDRVHFKSNPTKTGSARSISRSKFPA